MPDLIHADTGFLRDFAGRLDPAPATAAKAAAAQIRTSAGPCGDAMPGCAQFQRTVTEVTDRIEAFCTEVEEGIRAYAATARTSADIYATADAALRRAF